MSIDNNLLHYLLVGAPNSGKSSFFNMLTGHNRPVGNRPGVTVERAIAPVLQNSAIILEDLPGINYLDAQWENCSLDYQVTLKRLDNLGYGDVIVNVIDARFLRRQLYLTLQLMELQRPMLLVLKFCEKSGLKERLAATLGLPVYEEHALLTHAWHQLEASIARPPHLSKDIFSDRYWDGVVAAKEHLLTVSDIAQSAPVKALTSKSAPEQSDAESLVATWRHHWIEAQNFQQQLSFFSHTELLDSIFLHKILGLPLFLLMMYLVFAATIQLGSVGTDLLQWPLEAVALMFSPLLPQGTLLVTLVEGFYLGLSTVLSFVAPLGILYTALGLLEQTGYMQRAAVVIDRFMQWMKLPGQSFIPFVVGFGCNVPGIMATRTLQNPIDRLQTILMSPFMSCSARLAIFTVFTKAFFDASSGAYVIFSLYLLGMVIAVLTGLMMRLSLPKASYSPLVQEIVPYQWPHMSILLKASVQRLQDFVVKAAQMIIPTSMMIHVCVQHCALWDLAWLRPLIIIFEPMGLGEKEWPAIFSLLAGLIAKEIVLGTLEGLQKPPAAIANGGGDYDALAGDGLSQQKLATLFDSPHAAMSYLIFVLLYFPCISVTSTIAQESRRFWAVFSVVWSTSIAYIAAVLYYQYTAGNQSLAFLLVLTLGSALYLWGMALLLQRKLCQTSHYHPVNFRLKHS